MLEHHKIDTVISTLTAMPGVDAEVPLIKAADKSTVTKRYIPSTWGVKYTPEYVISPLLHQRLNSPALTPARLAAIFPAAAGNAVYLDTLARTSLEYTSVINGFFMDYFLAPHVKTYLANAVPAIDIAYKKAAIPGSGNVPVVFTHSFDIARFVVALLHSSEPWEKESYIIGDKLTLNQVLAIAEEARGEKFDVTYDSMEVLKQGKVTELPSHKAVYPYFPKEHLQGMLASFGVLFEERFFDVRCEKSLNGKFPKVKARGVRELVGEAWGGR